MATILPFRSFRLTNIVTSEFVVQNSTLNREFAIADLARSGLTMEDVAAEAPSMMKLKDGALAGYTIPYFGLDGQPLTDDKANLIMYRERFKYPEFSREQRYRQPHGDVLAKFNLPPSVPYFHPLSFSNTGDEAVCCEGEKKTAAVLHHLGLPAFGIGGCQMWRNPDRSGSVHPWIISFLRQRNISTVRIVPDGDVFRYDICNAYGTFARALESEGIQVRIVNPGDKIDDLLVRWREVGAPVHEHFSQLSETPVKDLVQSPASLISQFNLAFKVDAKDRPVVYQHSSNITKVLDQHRAAFPEIWRNTDTNTLMFGEVEARPGLTEMEVTNYFQHNLGFHSIRAKDVLQCMTSLAKRNERSPFLEWVKKQEWDGQSRLRSWLQDCWGIPDSEYVQEVGLKWLISSCARLDKPGTKIDWMLITIGPGGTGKTSMPAVMFQGNYQPIYGEQNDKDLHMLMHSKLCIGFDEMDSFGRREAGMMRALITQTSDSFRPPYEPSVENFPRRFIIYGCGNKEIFLHDQDGQRRYSILKVARKLDFKMLESIRAQLWAEAWAVYNAGGCDYWEVKGNVENAAQFEIPNLMQERIETFLWQQKKVKHGGNVAESVWFVMSQLTDHLDMGKVGPNSSQMREVADTLVKLGCKRPGRNAARHPETNVLGKWWVWEHKELAS